MLNISKAGGRCATAAGDPASYCFCQETGKYSTFDHKTVEMIAMEETQRPIGQKNNFLLYRLVDLGFNN